MPFMWPPSAARHLLKMSLSAMRRLSAAHPLYQGFLIKMECVVFEAFVMAEGHDKSHLRRDKYHFYIFMRKPFWKRLFRDYRKTP
jgi:hypothetical protein